MLGYSVVVDPSSLIRSVLALETLVLRRDWLSQRVRELPRHEVAQALDTLADASGDAQPEAREALVALVAMVVREADDPFIAQLRDLSIQHQWLGLLRLLRTYPMPSVLPESPADIPVYVVGRETTLGERRNIARRSARRAFDKLLRDPNPMVVEQLFMNPRLTEDDVIRLAAHRPARTDVLRVLTRYPLWLARPRVRLTILNNPRAPSTMTIPLLALCTRAELTQIADSPGLHVVLRATAAEHLERRTPVKGEAPEWMM